MSRVQSFDKEIGCDGKNRVKLNHDCVQERTFVLDVLEFSDPFYKDLRTN
jgi:hypothetical protein